MASQEDITFFKSTPWCRDLMENQGYTSIQTSSRTPKPDTEDAFFGETLNTQSTIRHCLTLISNPRGSSSTEADSSKPSVLDAGAPTLTADVTTTVTSDPQQDPSTISAAPIRDVIILADLGTKINGFPAMAHGGFLATLLDESMGILLTANQEYTNRINGVNESIDQVTAYLNVSYKGAVRTPGVVMVRAEITKVVGRKWFLRSVVRDRGDGRDLVVGEALFIAARAVARL